MQLRRLGREGPMVSAVGLGAMSFAGVYGGSDDAESEDTLTRALELGVNFIANRRADVVLATKFGGGGGDGLGKPDKVAPALEESLSRLHTDYVDLYYLH